MSSEADDTRIHTLSVYVANKPGVLARIAQVFARRGYNIDSLVVSPSMDGRYSRMTIAAKGSPDGLEQIIKQVGKLVEYADELSPHDLQQLGQACQAKQAFHRCIKKVYGGITHTTHTTHSPLHTDHSFKSPTTILRWLGGPTKQ